MVTQQVSHGLDTGRSDMDTAQRLLQIFANAQLLGVRHIIHVMDAEHVNTGLELDDLDPIAAGAVADKRVIGAQHKKIERVVLARPDGLYGPAIITRVGAEKRHREVPTRPTAGIASDLIL